MTNEKQAAASKKWYENNKELAKARAVECNARRRQEAKTLIIEAKNIPCVDCGASYPSYVMDFDHRDPSEKSFTIGNNPVRHTKEALLKEISKCDVVCANCHRERTHGNPLACGRLGKAAGC